MGIPSFAAPRHAPFSFHDDKYLRGAGPESVQRFRRVLGIRRSAVRSKTGMDTVWLWKGTVKKEDKEGVARDR